MVSSKNRFGAEAIGEAVDLLAVALVEWWDTDGSREAEVRVLSEPRSGSLSAVDRIIREDVDGKKESKLGSKVGFSTQCWLRGGFGVRRPYFLFRKRTSPIIATKIRMPLMDTLEMQSGELHWGW